jgi:hypothetical protein
MATSRIRRADPNRDPEVTRKIAMRLGTWTAWAGYVLTTTDLDFVHALVLLAAATYADLRELSASDTFYANEIAEIDGHVSPKYVGVRLAYLRRLGLLAGTGHAGFRFAGKMLEGKHP